MKLKRGIPRKYVCISMPSDLSERQDIIDFNLSLAVLSSLEKRGFLNYKQYSSCVEEMKKIFGK
ncbi:MAG: hypothetical protein NC394_02470 [Bacteroides sp.]|nr:hypothetical protein [Bacteroides sp.]